MKVTGIVKQKKNDERYNIYVEQEFLFSCSCEDLIRYSIKENMDFNEEKLIEMIKLCEFSKAYDYALFILQSKDYTEQEIKKKLSKKDFSEHTIQDVIGKLKDYSFIDDKRYAEKYIKHCINYKKYGDKKIIYNLKTKGINKQFIDEISIDDENLYKNAYILAQKKLLSIKDKDNTSTRLYRYLISKGYDYELTSKVIRNVLKDID